MYGVKFEDDKIVIVETNAAVESGYEIFNTWEEAHTRGLNMEYRALRREFNDMSLEELKTDRAKELERRIWGRHANFDGCEYVPGEIIQNRIKEKTLP